MRLWIKIANRRLVELCMAKIPSFAIPRILTLMSGRVFKCGRVSKFMTRRFESQVHEVLIKSKTSEFELLNLRMKSWYNAFFIVFPSLNSKIYDCNEKILRRKFNDDLLRLILIRKVNTIGSTFVLETTHLNWNSLKVLVHSLWIEITGVLWWTLTSKWR